MGHDQTNISNYRRATWHELHVGDDVYIKGRFLDESYMYGPYVVVNVDMRLMRHSNMKTVFVHKPEDLYIEHLVFNTSKNKEEYHGKTARNT